MTENNKERLESILNDLPYSIRHEGNTVILIEYAKEQAERAQELEDSLINIQNQLFSIRGKNKLHDAEITGLCADIKEALEESK